ncbi:MAG: hypothetical protein ACFFC7_01565 [Candidatus Hermodarchaeota archaeon]
MDVLPAWHRCTLKVPLKIYQRIRKTGTRVHLPSTGTLTLKGGLSCPVLTFAWSSPVAPEHQLIKEQMMMTDLELINLVISVIFEAGSQISRSILCSPSKLLLHKIDQLYYHLTSIQKKLDRYPDNWVGQSRSKRVNPRGTSSSCPRYASKGMKIKEPVHKTSNK